MIYIDVATVASLLGKTVRSIQRDISSGKIYSETADGNVGRGGVSYQVPSSALPAEAQIHYYEMQGEQAEKENCSDTFDLGAYRAKHGEAGVEKLLSRLQAVLRLIGMRNSGGIENLTEAVEALGTEYGMSGATLRRLETRYKKDGLGGLVCSGRSDKGESRSMCREARRRIYELYLDANKLKAATI